ncbi:MAG: penicillin acylase family protein, partial [Armatimonadetes bacterium]|nr:penicillin acylase family protein [Armatimonadota bacterium]
VFLREGNRAYAVACPYFDQVGLVTQLYRMGQATTLGQLKDALFMLQLMEQNTMMADVEGNLFYFRNGRVPVRPEGLDFTKPVPGNTAETEWRGLYPPARLVQLENPPQGYMQNNNCGPEFMLVDCPLKPGDYPPEVYGGGGDHSRSLRGRRLLHAADRLTVEGAIEIALDTHAEGVEEWQSALDQARQGVPESAIAGEPGLAEVLAAFLAWDGCLTAEASAAPFYRALLEAAREAPLDCGPIHRREPLNNEQIQAVRAAVLTAVRRLSDLYGRTLIPWGEVHRVRRGDRSFPAPGGDAGSGSTLRAIGVARDEASGICYGESGQSWTQVVVLERGNVRSFSATPYGQSDHPSSPHFFDQGEKLFSRLKLKDTYFQPGSLEGHVESEITLTFEP